MSLCVTKIKILDGPHKGRHSLFLGEGLSRDGQHYTVATNGSREFELAMLQAIIHERQREGGFHTALERAQLLARTWQLHSYVAAEKSWYQCDRFTFEGTFALQVEEIDGRPTLVRGARLLDNALAPASTLRVSSLWDEKLAAVESSATRFSAILASLEAGPVRDAAAGTASAVSACVQDARRLAGIGTQLGSDLADARVVRVLTELESLTTTVEHAITEAVELHLQVRERPVRGLDALPARDQLRAITQGVTELR